MFSASCCASSRAGVAGTLRPRGRRAPSCAPFATRSEGTMHVESPALPGRRSGRRLCRSACGTAWRRASGSGRRAARAKAHGMRVGIVLAGGRRPTASAAMVFGRAAEASIGHSPAPNVFASNVFFLDARRGSFARKAGRKGGASIAGTQWGTNQNWYGLADRSPFMACPGASKVVKTKLRFHRKTLVIVLPAWRDLGYIACRVVSRRSARSPEVHRFRAGEDTAATGAKDAKGGNHPARVGSGSAAPVRRPP
jgi:hypothetical protein